MVEKQVMMDENQDVIEHIKSKEDSGRNLLALHYLRSLGHDVYL